MKKVIITVLMIALAILLIAIVKFTTSTKTSSSTSSSTSEDQRAIEQQDTLPIDPQSSAVIETLFSIRSTQNFVIKVPEVDALAIINHVQGDSIFCIAEGSYQNHIEDGVVRLMCNKICAIESTDSKEMWFAAPFFVANSGTGLFYYLGLFKIDQDSYKLYHTDSFFLGDRISAIELKSLAPMQLNIQYKQHGEGQSMSDEPNEKIDQTLKIEHGKWVQ